MPIGVANGNGHPRYPLPLMPLGDLLRPSVAILLLSAGALLLSGTLSIPTSAIVVTVVALAFGLAILLDVLPLPDALGATLTGVGLLALLSPTMGRWLGAWAPVAVQVGGGVLLLTSAVIAWGGAEPIVRRASERRGHRSDADATRTARR